MKEIFTDLYKKVIGFFQKQEKEEAEEKGRDVAVNRMKLVLMQDRTNLTPFLLEKMRGEMIDVLAKYVEMDKDALELSFEQEGEQMALMLSIPVLRAKEEDEIQAIIEAEEKAKAKAKVKAEAEEAEFEDSEDFEEEAAEEFEEEVEETDEDLDENIEEEVCSCVCEDEEIEEISGTPDEVEEEIDEEISEKKLKKKD